MAPRYVFVPSNSSSAISRLLIRIRPSSSLSRDKRLALPFVVHGFQHADVCINNIYLFIILLWGKISLHLQHSVSNADMRLDILRRIRLGFQLFAQCSHKNAK